jgi:hypothetical protein
LDANRRRTTEAEGRVARRGGGGGLAASSSRSSAAAHAIVRFRNCDREADDDAEITDPSAAITRSRIVVLSPAAATSIVIVTAVSEVLAC